MASREETTKLLPGGESSGRPAAAATPTSCGCEGPAAGGRGRSGGRSLSRAGRTAAAATACSALVGTLLLAALLLQQLVVQSGRSPARVGRGLPGHGTSLFRLAADAVTWPGSWRPSSLAESHGCAKYGCHGSFELGRACQCNKGCQQFKDCCEDYEEVCQSHDRGRHDHDRGGGRQEHARGGDRDGDHDRGGDRDRDQGGDRDRDRDRDREGAGHRSPKRPPPAPHCQAAMERNDECRHPRILAHPGASAPKVCMCPPPLVAHKNSSCNDCLMPKKAQRMTFYMYRAMGKERYEMQNVNMASLSGVLWYLHREVVASTPRKFHIDRIARYSVTIKITDDYYNHTPNQFGPFVAFDFGSAKGRSEIWQKYGFVVGCQLVDPKLYNYVPRDFEQPSCHPRTAFPCRAPKWYSLPGPCPEFKESEKSPACATTWPGGMCRSPVVTGSHTCTYFAAPAGEILLDELENISDYKSWWIGTNETTGAKTPNGNIEYDPHLDAGVGTDFWDGRHDKQNCTRRMEAVEKLFKEKYPELPESLPEPPCN